MRIEDVKILGTEFNEERVHILKYFLRKNELTWFLTEDSSGETLINFISVYIDDYRDEKKRERKLITFDDFVNIFNVDTNPDVEYEYIYEIDENDKSIVQKKVEW